MSNSPAVEKAIKELNTELLNLPYKKEIEMEKIDVEKVMDLPVEVKIYLGKCNLTTRTVSSLGEGSILSLDKLAGEPVDVEANGVKIATGEVVVIDESFGIRITEMMKNEEEDSDE